jgi:hypothetical protein
MLRLHLVEHVGCLILVGKDVMTAYAGISENLMSPTRRHSQQEPGKYSKADLVAA